MMILRKTLISIVFAMMIAVCGVLAAMTITEKDYQRINFATTSLQYRFSEVQYYPDSMALYAEVTYMTAVPFAVNDDRYFLNTTKTTRYTYDGTDFWQCILSYPEVSCFEAYVLPAWATKFMILDGVQRRYLTSLQDNGKPFFTYELRSYLGRFNT